jgi:hypothetical protein
VSLSQKVRLELDDGREIETTYNGIDLRAWEAKHKKSALVESMSLSMLTWLGHHAAVRTGEVNGELKEYSAFDAVCVSVEGVRAEEPPDPTETKTTSSTARKSRASRKTAGDDSSASSP